jgi:asparagine synthase (glutamine-hydrolysing)
MGIKPLYYARTLAGFSFASEVKALLADGDTPREVNAAALNAYFSLGYVPTPVSAFEHVQKLAPGRILTLELKTGTGWQKP